MEYREGLSSKPLQGVEVVVRNANSSVSNKRGEFQLEFRTSVAGQRVEIRSITKLDYEVFNTEAVEQWNINPEQPFVIKMVKSELFKRIKDEYSRVSSQSYKSQYDREVARYQKERDEHRITEEAYQQEIIRLSNEYDRQLANMDNYIDRFARIDLSVISSEERAIIELVKAGQIDEAIRRYDELNLVEQYEQTIASLAELKEAESKIQRSIAKHKEASEEIYQSLSNQINLLMMSGGEANLAKVNDIYNELLVIDNTNIELHFRYIGFCFEQTHYDEALACAKHLLTIAQSDEDIAMAYSVLGDAYANLLKSDEAFDAYYKAYDLITNLINLEEPTLRNMIMFSNVSNSIGLLFADMNLMDGAIEIIELAYKIRNHIVEYQPDPQHYHSLASIANNMANIYLRIYDAERALQYSSEAISIYESLAASSEMYSVDLAKSYMNKACIYYALGQYDSAEPLFLKAIELYANLVVVNPDRFKFDFAYSLTNYGFMLTESFRYDAAYLYFMCASALYNCCEAMPGYMRMQEALLNVGISEMLSKSGEYGEIEEYYRKIYSVLPTTFDDIHLIRLSINVGIRMMSVLENAGLIELAEEYGENYREVAVEAYNMWPQYFGVQYYKYLMKMGLFYINYKDDLSLARSCITEAKSIANLFKENHYTYYHIYRMIAVEALVYICKCEGKFDEAMAMIRENVELIPLFNDDDRLYSEEEILSMVGIWSNIQKMWNEVMRVDSIQLHTNAVNVYAY
jgi:tetratricopeptide (TPR) repeat protein